MNSCVDAWLSKIQGSWTERLLGVRRLVAALVPLQIWALTVGPKRRRVGALQGGAGEFQCVLKNQNGRLNESPVAVGPLLSDQLCRRGGIGIGMLYVVAPTPTPPWQEFGGTVQTRRDEGHSAAQNM